MVESAVFAVIALACAGTMGFAIQRGATCTVAAVGEIFERRTAYRLFALAEAAVWVASGVLIAREFGLLQALPNGIAPSGWTMLGGVLLGLGAWVNRACAFGAIARFGSGELAYAATPLGFLAGAATTHLVFGDYLAGQSIHVPMLAMIPAYLGWTVVPLAAYRLLRAIGRSGKPIWEPHQATVIIGLTFVVLFVVAGPWSYTEVLASTVMGGMPAFGFPVLLFLALLAGTCLGGWTAGRLVRKAITPGGVARCLLGGALMGWGSLLIPGGNDGMILIGMPLLLPHAWVGIFAMCVTIALALALERRWA